MKPIQTSLPDTASMLVFGAHPDDIEFGCGAILAQEARIGRRVHLVVCSRGESSSRGSPEERIREAENSAAIMGAELEFLLLDGDAHLEIHAAHAIRLAEVIRRLRPGIVLAPSTVQNQHPDHWRLGTLVRDACRLARYGGIIELREQPIYSIHQLLFYAVTDEAEPTDISPILIDVSNPEVVSAWTSAMEAHVTQVSARSYIELQLARSRLLGFRAGVAHAMALFPNDPPVFQSLRPLTRSARQF